MDEGMAGLRQDWALGLEEAMYDASLWQRAQTAVDGLIDAVLAGQMASGALASLLATVPAPANAREEAMLCLLRAGLLRDCAALVDGLRIVARDQRDPAPCHSLDQAQYILRAVLFLVWVNRLPGPEPAAFDHAMRDLWAAILDRYRALMAPLPPRPAGRHGDLIVLLTGQYLRGVHQPSLDIVEFARLLGTEFGRPVLLVNSADGPVCQHFPYLSGFTSPAEADLTGRRPLSTGGVDLDFRQMPPGLTRPHEAAAMAADIIALNPDMVLSFGTMNPLADLLRCRLDVVSIPFGTYLPVAQPGYVALPRRLAPSDTPGLAQAGVSADRVIPIFYGYSLPATGAPKDRAALGLPDGAIVTSIIGLRLDADVTPALAAGLDAMVQREPRLFFLFIGPMASYAERVRPWPHLAVRSRAHGYDPDVLSVLAVVDLYLNPPRGGGGASAAYALALGVPAFTLAQGDVGVVAGPDFHLARLADFPCLAARFVDDADFAADLRATATARYNAISSRTEMLRQIIDGVSARRGSG